MARRYQKLMGGKQGSARQRKLKRGGRKSTTVNRPTAKAYTGVCFRVEPWRIVCGLSDVIKTVEQWIVWACQSSVAASRGVAVGFWGAGPAALEASGLRESNGFKRGRPKETVSAGKKPLPAAQVGKKRRGSSRQRAEERQQTKEQGHHGGRVFRRSGCADESNRRQPRPAPIKLEFGQMRGSNVPALVTKRIKSVCEGQKERVKEKRHREQDEVIRSGLCFAQ